MFENNVELKKQIDKKILIFKIFKIIILSLLLLFGAFCVVQFCFYNVFGWGIYLSILFVVAGCWFMFEPFNVIVNNYLFIQELKILFSSDCMDFYSERLNSNFLEKKSFLFNISGYHYNVDRYTKQVYISKDSNIDKYSYYCVYESYVNPDYLIAVCTKKHNRPDILNSIKVQDFAQGV